MILIAFLVLSFAFSILVNGLLLRFSKNLGIRNYQEYIIRWSSQTKPSLGGISFYISFLFTIIIYAIVFAEDDVFRNVKLLGLFGAGTLAFLLGLADDAYNTKPLLKLFAQTASGIILVLTGSVLRISNDFYVDGMFTVIWVIAVMNSVNMLDNMDGITTVTSISILLASSFGFYWILGQTSSSWLVMNFSMIGALLGFLYYNWNPSKIYMGDAGSQFLGLFLAFTSIDSFWNVGVEYGNHRWIGMLICLVAFTPAAADTLTVIINRLRKGKSPMVGGKDHTTHHLVYMGLNDKQVGIVFVLLGLLSALLASTMIYLVSIDSSFPVYLLALFFFIVFFILFRITQKFKENLTKE
jgi:UDP-GlcNAc:undecaprenyl-phosphate/decaprenyl-phosphate GlcNAc-1-phosphate transferase